MSKLKVTLYMMIAGFLFLVGIVVGMLLGTYALIDHILYGLSGSTFIVNLNETKLMNEFNKTIMPIFQRYQFNYTLDSDKDNNQPIWFNNLSNQSIEKHIASNLTNLPLETFCADRVSGIRYRSENGTEVYLNCTSKQVIPVEEFVGYYG